MIIIEAAVSAIHLLVRLLVEEAIAVSAVRYNDYLINETTRSRIYGAYVPHWDLINLRAAPLRATYHNAF